MTTSKEETLPKNVATSIKDPKFLNFFFSRIQLPRLEDQSFLLENGILQDYPYVSLCGREVNFIRPAALPIVFHTKKEDKLFFGGNLDHRFCPSHLAVSPKSGQLFHRNASTKTRITNECQGAGGVGFGLIRSSVALEMSTNLEWRPTDYSSNELVYVEGDKLHKVPLLPANAEPGSWAMPTASL